MASPAKVLQQILVNLMLVKMPPVPGKTVPYTSSLRDQSYFCYVGSIPDEINRAVILTNSAGMVFGKRQTDGKTLEHPGIKILVRDMNQEDASNMAQKLVDAIDPICRITVSVDGEDNYVQSIYRVGTVTDLGEEKDKKRFLTVANVRMAFQDIQP